MQVPLMRNVALVAAGNAAIASKSVKPLWPDYLAFKFCKECTFLDETQAIVARDPNDWIGQRARDSRGLRLHHESRKRWVDDRLTAGFAGGGPRWLIEVARDGGSDIWEGGEKLGDRNAPDRKIWSAAYMRIATAQKVEVPAVPLREAITELDATLAQIEAFARENAVDFVRAFADAREGLSNPGSKMVTADELLPFADLNGEAKQLWAACEAAWVFGGMGSWNDMSFEGDKGQRYESLSATLFAQLNDAIVAVANSTFPP